MEVLDIDIDRPSILPPTIRNDSGISDDESLEVSLGD